VKIGGKVGSVISQNTVIQLSHSSEMYTCCENTNTANKPGGNKHWKTKCIYPLFS